jgi:hypothetical protein
MKTIHIGTPIWYNRSVGLNIKDMSPDEEVIIEIMYVEKKTGTRAYPDTYKMLVKDIMKYPVQGLKQNTTVHIVPISSLSVIKDEKNDPQMSLF